MSGDLEAKVARLAAGDAVRLLRHDHERTDALVRGDTGLRRVTWTGADGWRCSCPVPGPGCSHILATRRHTSVDPSDSVAKPEAAP